MGEIDMNGQSINGLRENTARYSIVEVLYDYAKS